MVIKALIIDDEEPARRVLSNLLQEYCEEVRVVGTCKNVPDAVIEINKHQPDVVFCDIEMPNFSGFDLLSFFKEIDFEIIFATGYSEYAVKAFEISAVDYLLKPIQIEALQKAVLKIKKRADAHGIHERVGILKENLSKEEIQKIALPVSDGLVFIRINEVSHIEADGAYAVVWLVDGNSILVSRRLRFFEDLLGNHHLFLRVHRSSMININCIQKYSRNEGIIVLDNDKSVRVARDKKNEFEDYIKGIRL